MAKSSGVGSALIVGAYDLSGDIGSVGTIEVSRGVFDVTGIDKSAVERIPGRKDGRLEYMAFWNTTAGQAHPVLSALPTTDVQTSYLHGNTVGEVGASMVGKRLTYGPSLGADGGLTAKISAQANGYGLEWGELLTTGKQTFASGTVTGTNIDFGASTSFGAAAYLHVISIASGTATVAVQDSPDNITYTNLTGMTLAAVSAAGVQRVQGATNATVNRYVQAKVTGTYTNLVAVLLFVRYTESP